MSTTRLFYARAMIQTAKLVDSPQVEQALVAVMTAEGSAAHWNPCDTTLGRPGATPYNSFGSSGQFHVWNYASAADGIAATVATLEQPNMSQWLSSMRSGMPIAAAICRAFSQTPWGGFGDVLPLEMVQQWTKKPNLYVLARQHIVSGPGVWTYDAKGHPFPSVTPHSSTAPSGGALAS